MKTRKTVRKQAIFLLAIVVTVCLASEAGAGGIWVDPNIFDVNIIEGCTLTQTLTIGNDGIEDLNFTLRSREISREILGGLSGGGTAAAAAKAAQGNIVLEYRFSEPVVNRGAEYDVVQLEGTKTYHRTGAPIVPVRPVTVLVPFGKKVVSTRVIALKTRELPGTYRLPPAQEPYPLSHVGPIVQTEPNTVIYSQATPWPGMLHEKVTTQSKRGYQLFTVNLFPVQYVPTTGKVTYTTKMQLEIELADSAMRGVLRPSENTKKALRKRVDNPNLLGSYDAKAMSVEKVGGEAALLSGGPYQYVIITNQALESASGPWNFQALRDAKIAHGMTATIVTTEWIYSNYDGTRPDGASDNQTGIRNFLIEAYQDWGTEYVLLGGTKSIVPARMFRVDGVDMPVDMYYGCVDPEECTFDGDADGIYGESNDGVGSGDVDLYGEIYVGRAAVQSVTEVANFVQKTLAYSLTHNDYISLISMVGEHLGFGGVAEYAKPAMEQIRLGGDYDGYFTYGFENHTQPDFYDFDTSTNLYDADGSWPKSELIGLMNEGVHIFNHLGHANYTYDMKLYVSDLASLTNTDYFFAYSQGCDPGGFDATNCFAEVITTMEYGAFAVVMNARSGWGRGNSTDGPSQRFARQFWDAALNEDMLEMGRANQDSKEDNLWDINGERIRWCYYELTLFGDPAQELRFEEACEWITLEPQEGTVGSGESIDISVTFDAMELAPGVYGAEIVIISNDPCSPETVPVTMTVNPDDLQVAPAEGFESSGAEGGPFEPQCVVYILTNNNDTQSLNWTTWESEDWLAVEPNEGVLDPCDSIEVSVCISPDANLLDPNIYTDVLTFRNTDSGSINPRSISLTIKPADCFTESFDESGSDLEGLMLTFSPDGSGAYYEACREKVDEFPTDPNGGTYVPLGDDDFAEVFLGGPNPRKKISFYGTSYNRFYIGSNGYITFGDGDTEYSASLEKHFNMLRISGLFADLSPSDNISYKKLGDRVAVTFQDVWLFGDKTKTSSFQIEMFFVDGTIRITWLKAADTSCVAGLSRGRGLPPVFFEESDLSEYLPCWPWCDFNRDYFVNFADFALFAMHWLDEDCSIPYWCGKADLDFSGMVETADVGIFAEDWLTKVDWFLQPISHWKFDEGEGDTAYDSVGNNHGTLKGDPQWVGGKIGDYALDFDGDGDYVYCGIDTSLEPANLTIATWVKTQRTSGNERIVSKLDRDASGKYYGYGLLLRQDKGNKFYFEWCYGTTSGQSLSSTSTFQTDVWYFMAATFDDTTKEVNLYINGTKEANTTAIGSIAYQADWPLSIGRETEWETCFQGTIDEVRIYDRALSAGEIWQLYYEGLGPKAYNPNPSDGATGVDPNTILSWSPGKDALSHDVYLGTNYNDVNDATIGSPEYQGNFDVDSFDPCGLELETSYYWRIDELDGSNTHKGDVWSFRTFGLVSWWEFEEGEGGIAYDSAGNNDGTLVGNTTWVTGKIGDYALDFDGDEDYVLVPHSSSLNFDGYTDSYSFSLWVKSDNPAPVHGFRLIEKYGPGETKCPVSFQGGATTCYALISDGPISPIVEFGNIWNGQWRHLVFAVDNLADELFAYVDGVEVDSTTNTVTSTTTNTRDMAIGDSPVYERSFNGTIDDVHIYDRALSAEEIWQLYDEGRGYKAFAPNPADEAAGVDPNTVLSWSPGKDALSHDVYLGTDYNDINDANVSSPEYMGNFDVDSFDPCGLELDTTYFWRIDEVNETSISKGDVWSFITWESEPDPNLVGWWEFDEDEGDIAYDSTGNNDGTIYGATWTSGQIDGALDFDGTNDYVTVGSPASLDDLPLSNMTVCAWIYDENTSGTTWGTVAGCYAYNHGWSFRTFSNSGGDRSLHFQAPHSSGEYDKWANSWSSDGTIIPNTWHHVAAVWDGSTKTAKLYIDGTEPSYQTTNPGVGAYNSDASRDKEIGRIPHVGGGQYFNGTIDDVRIYDRALDAGEILQLYQGGLGE